MNSNALALVVGVRITDTAGLRDLRIHQSAEKEIDVPSRNSSPQEPLFDAQSRASFRRRLLSWYRRHARDLPWRNSHDAYRVWVSEIMLQQTQVETVKPYFQRFLKVFPSIAALARADEQRVLRQWEGLGYYRRARQLHKAAQVIVDEHNGQFPQEMQDVRDLPGIGRYTAGAILSIAFDQRQPILEANTIRLFSRLLAYRDDPTKGPGQQLLWQAAEELLPRRHVGDFNQALMELGSQVCTPREPQCGVCPLVAQCEARLQGVVDQVPLQKAGKKFEEVHEAAVVIRRRNQILLLRCPEGERWAGLWDFPRFVLENRHGAACQRELIDKVQAMTRVVIEPTGALTTIKHGVTRFRITLHCHSAQYLSSARGRNHSHEMQWIKPSELEALPLSTTGRKLGRLVVESNS